MNYSIVPHSSRIVPMLVSRIVPMLVCSSEIPSHLFEEYQTFVAGRDGRLGRSLDLSERLQM